MKGYEATTQMNLLRRTPVIIRADGKAFHTYVKRFNRGTDSSMAHSPFSTKLHSKMIQTAYAICQTAQNATFAFVQSDEISILLRDWDKHETEQWFDGKVQKIASVCASMATGYFNFYMGQDIDQVLANPSHVKDMALFDARVYNLPFEEVTNYFIWRQQDATRNSISMLGRHYYSAKQLHCKNSSQMQDMLMELGVNWNDIRTWQKRGACVVPIKGDRTDKYNWIVDEEVPIFTSDREYIERHLRAKDDA